MKKTLSLFAVALAAIIFSLSSMTSCKPDGGNPPDDPDKGKDSTTTTTTVYEEVTDEEYAVKCKAYGQAGGAYHFVIEMQDLDVQSLFGMILGGQGDILTLDIYSKTGDNMLPEMAEYKIGGSSAPYMMKGNGTSGSMVKVVDENDPEKVQGVDVNVTSGSVTLAKEGSDYNIKVSITLADGTTRALSYTGAMTAEDAGPYSGEGEQTTAELKGLNIERSNLGQQVNENTDVIQLGLYGSNGEGTIWLLVPKGETDLVHHYEFSSSGEAWTAYASPGAVDGAPSPSYVVLVIQQYFLTGGTLDITADGMTMNATTAKGSTITINYTGSI